MLAYITCIPALAFLLIEPYSQNRFLRFHSYQSVFLTVVFLGWLMLSGLVSAASLAGGILLVLFELALVAMWAFAAYKASLGEEFQLPVIGPLAAQHASRQP